MQVEWEPRGFSLSAFWGSGFVGSYAGIGLSLCAYHWARQECGKRCLLTVTFRPVWAAFHFRMALVLGKGAKNSKGRAGQRMEAGTGRRPCVRITKALSLTQGRFEKNLVTKRSLQLAPYIVTRNSTCCLCARFQNGRGPAANLKQEWKLLQHRTRKRVAIAFGLQPDQG